MKQYNFIFDSCTEAKQKIDEIKALTEGKDAAAFIFTGLVPQNELNELLVFWDEKLPNVKRVGISVGYAAGDTALMNTEPRIKFNLITADSPCFYPVQIPSLPGQEVQAAETLNQMLESIQDLKAIALYPSNRHLSTSAFLRSINYDVPVFGAEAVPHYQRMFYNASDTLEEGYGIGKTILSSGFTAMIIAGRDIHVSLDYILGWDAIGKEMDITLEDNSSTGETKIRLIDGKPAVEIYRKYLGVEWDENFVINVCEFPLMIKRNGVDLCYVPVESVNGGLTLSGAVEEGEKIRFSYSTHEHILKASKQGSERMASFGADAVIMSLCGNRINFLQDDAHIEWDYFKEYYPELVYCHGYYEIAFRNTTGAAKDPSGFKGGVLNGAFVAVGLKECEGPKLCTTTLGVQTQDEPEVMHGQIPLSYRVSRFFSIMTDELTHYQHHLEDEVEKKTRENEGLSFHVVQTLAEAIDAKDTYTNGHSGRVASYSREIARRAGMSEAKQNEILMMGLLHDVGKIGVPDAVINKPGRLNDEEFAMIKTHPATGARILEKIQEMPALATGAHWHHERYDGRGYPDGLKGEEIPAEARIIAVADAYDAMTSNRSYREVMPQEKVREQISNGLGTQFDPVFGKIMLEMIDEDKDYRMREIKPSESKKQL